jgi:HD-like signal output (HDOD) protein
VTSAVRPTTASRPALRGQVPGQLPLQPASPPAVQDLLADVHRLPAQRPALLRVVHLADDDDCSPRQLAEVAASDPAFAARLLQLANSAYYGRAGRITAIAPAVGVLGAETVRGLAVTMALGLSGESGPLPDGFWDRAATAAAGSRLLAPRVGADPGDAFCVGLLHEVGEALLFRAAPQDYGLLQATHTGPALAVAERAWCGVSSGELAAAALGSAGVPGPVCEAIAGRETEADPADEAPSPLTRALRGGVLLSRAVASGDLDASLHDALVDVLGGRLEPGAVGELALRTASQAAALSATMR